MICLPLFRCLVALAFGAFALACSEGEGRAAARVADASPFDAERAFSHLERQVAFGPRVPGTEGHRRQLEWMQSFLAERSDTVLLQPFSHVAESGDTLRLTNVFARFRPDARDRILLIAHWDTRPRADQSPRRADRDLPVPGANDGASGTAVLLEIAEVLRQHRPPMGVDLLFVDGEDFGPGERDMYLGAKHFARNLPPGYQPLYGVLLDMVGDRDLRFPVEGYSARYAPEVVRRVWDLAREMGYGHVFVNETGPYISDDHIPLNEAGIRTIDIIDFDYGPGHRYWHTPEDVPANTSAESLGIVGRVMTELIRRGG